VRQRPVVEEAAQVFGQVLRALVAPRRVGHQALAGDALQAPGHVRPLLAQRGHGAAALHRHRLDQGRQRRVAGALVERALAGQHLEQHHAQRVDVGPPVHLAGQGGVAGGQGAQVLRGHVGDGAADGGPGRLVVEVLGEVEVQQQRLAVAVEQDVARFDVAVQHTAVVRVL